MILSFKQFFSYVTIDELVKSAVSPPLAGGDQGEGYITDWNSNLFTLTPTLSRQGRGSISTFCETGTI